MERETTGRNVRPPASNENPEKDINKCEIDKKERDVLHIVQHYFIYLTSKTMVSVLSGQ